MKKIVSLNVNGDSYELAIDQHRSLNDVLREDLNLTGTKLGCGTGDCGACTVIVDGKSICSCLTLAIEMEGKEVMTIEGLAPNGEELHPIQEAFVDNGGIQCGFCTAGMELSAYYLLKNNPDPSDKEIRESLSGNLCRCTGYTNIVESINDVSKREGRGPALKEEI